MIGQKQLIKQIDELIDKGFPQFVVITGARGSGKKLLAAYIASKVSKVNWTLEDNKIANIRQMIQMSYNNYQSTLCIIPEADTLSIPAQNAILKIVEEPPKNTYFVMTVQDINYVLSTIKSRAFILTMNPYTKEELLQYMEEKYTKYCDVPGEYDIIKDYDLPQFVQFVDKVRDNVGTTSLSNIFKISNDIAFKDEDNGYDLEMFFKVFICECMTQTQKGKFDINHLRMVLRTNKVLQELHVRGINRQILFNNWIMEMRAIYGSKRTEG